MQRLIDMRGGVKKLAEEAPHMVSSLVVYILYAFCPRLNFNYKALSYQLTWNQDRSPRQLLQSVMGSDAYQ
jgi:hypothetical protein